VEITERIKRLSYEQLEMVIKARRNVPLVGFISVNSKARSACIQRHAGWMDELLKYTNASIEASVRAKLNNTLSTATIISAFESMGLGIIAKKDLVLEEYDLLISSVVMVFPELVVLEQDWTPLPIDETSRYRPRNPYMLPPEESRTQATSPKKTRTFRRKEDNEEEQFDAAFLEGILKPKKTEVKLTQQEAVAKMLEAMKPKGLVIESVEAQFPITSKIQKEMDELVELDSQPEDVEIKPEVDFADISAIPDEILKAPSREELKEILKPDSLKIQPSTEGNGFRLCDLQTSIYWGPLFNTPIEAIVWATKEGIKVK
jgi:hypothetical protein